LKSSGTGSARAPGARPIPRRSRSTVVRHRVGLVRGRGQLVGRYRQDAGPGEGVRVQQLLELGLGEQAAFEGDVVDPPPGQQRLLCDGGGLAVADQRRQAGDDPDRLVHQPARWSRLASMPRTHRSVRVAQPARRWASDWNRQWAMIGSKAFELQLPAFGGDADRDVVADDLKSDLVDDPGDDGVDLPGHDAGAGLDRGQPDLGEARPGAG